MTEREVYRNQLRQSIASLETDSLLKCIRYVAANRSLTLCGSARSYLDSMGKFDIRLRGNLFYWLENDAPMAWLDWLSETENFCKAIWSAV
jgi:hypothetical protein